MKNRKAKKQWTGYTIIAESWIFKLSPLNIDESISTEENLMITDSSPKSQSIFIGLADASKRNLLYTELLDKYDWNTSNWKELLANLWVLISNEEDKSMSFEDQPIFSDSQLKLIYQVCYTNNPIELSCYDNDVDLKTGKRIINQFKKNLKIRARVNK